MEYGVDTFQSRLDLITWDSFRAWNGGTSQDGTLTGGEPAFAGRHFLGGDLFRWGHGEATNCMAHPMPESIAQLTLLTPAIAPIQAVMSGRQAVTGALGFAYGSLDADALCRRLLACLDAGEFTLPSGSLVFVWLTVDPNAEFSADYWAGWADTVNSKAWSLQSQGVLLAQLQPFRAAIICSYTAPDGKLAPDPHVPAALIASGTAYRGSDTKCYATWADAATEAHPQQSTPPDWESFGSAYTPIVWRYAQGGDFGGNFSVDAANPGGDMANATDFMLIAQPWQPNVPSLLNFGFITDQANGITDTQITTIEQTPIPSFKDTGGHYTLSGGQVCVIGRYLKPNVRDATHPKGAFAMTRAEASSLSAVPQFGIFTIWEDIDATVGQPTTINYFDPAHNMGAQDGKNAFSYCGDTLGQPPHTPVFFTVDFDAADPPHPMTAAQAQQWIEGYFTALKQARDTYTTQNPDRPYLIGLYANGETNRWCYRQGIVDMFWQSGSTGSTGNTLPTDGFNWAPPIPLRPWYHANRWQFNIDKGLKAAGWTVVPGADPDADWGDGGAWTLADPLVQQFEQQRQLLKGLELGGTFDMFGNLVLPPPFQPGLPTGGIQ